MKNIEQILVKKIKQTPMLWAFYIVAFLCSLCFIGVGVKTFAATTGMALLGCSLSIASFVFMYGTLKLYIKHDLVK